MGVMSRLPTPPRWLTLGFRIIQLLSAMVSMILYAIFIARLATGSAGADRAVVGIAAAAVIWTISAFVQQWNQKSRRSSSKNIDSDQESKQTASDSTFGAHSKRKKVAIALLVFLILDVIFVGLMIASAAISGRRQSCEVPEMDDDNDADNAIAGTSGGYNGSQCGLQRGVLALSIVNAVSFSGSGLMDLFHGTHTPPNPMDAQKNARSLFQELF